MGAGNSTSIQNYFAIDYMAQNGIGYYRLKQTDFNGEYTFSELQTINFEKKNGLSFNIYHVYCVEKKVYINVNSKRSQVVNTVIYSVGGTEVLRQENMLLKGTNNIEFDSQMLNTGLYIIEISNNKRTIHKKSFIN